jgi:hypothetical protein
LTAIPLADHDNAIAQEWDGPSLQQSAECHSTFKELYPHLEPCELVRGTSDPRFRDAWELASVSGFRPGRDLPA